MSIYNDNIQDPYTSLQLQSLENLTNTNKIPSSNLVDERIVRVFEERGELKDVIKCTKDFKKIPGEFKKNLELLKGYIEAKDFDAFTKFFTGLKTREFADRFMAAKLTNNLLDDLYFSESRKKTNFELEDYNFVLKCLDEVYSIKKKYFLPETQKNVSMGLLNPDGFQSILRHFILRNLNKWGGVQSLFTFARILLNLVNFSKNN